MIRDFLLKIRRAETPFYKRLKRIAKAMRSARLPLPRSLHPLLRTGYRAQLSCKNVWSWGCDRLYREPLFRGRCETIGERFMLHRMPFVMGHAEIHIGNDVSFYGQVDIFSGGLFDHPRVLIGNGVHIGHGLVMIVNREITIEDGVNISPGVRIMDTDSHPRDAESRVANLPPEKEEVKPVRIGRYAWIGEHTYIQKGVTIGEGAIIGVNSVVVTDIPAYTIAMGNPARVILKTGLKPVPADRESVHQ